MGLILTAQAFEENQRLTLIDQTDLQIIISLLKKIDEDESIDINNHTLVNTVIYLADDCLTGDDNRYNIECVKKAGFDVFAGEQDRFGLLTGCIQLKRGIIVFG